MLVTDEGYLNLIEFLYLDQPAKVIGTRSGETHHARNAIDTIRTQDGKYHDVTRGDLYLMQKDGRVKALHG